MLLPWRVDVTLSSKIRLRPRFQEVKFGSLRGREGEESKLNNKEIGRIKLTHTRELVASLVDNEKLDLGVWVESDSYKGWTK